MQDLKRKGVFWERQPQLRDFEQAGGSAVSFPLSTKSINSSLNHGGGLGLFTWLHETLHEETTGHVTGWEKQKRPPECALPKSLPK